MDLDGRVAIISGAGRGVGREHALLLAKLGGRVVVNDLGGAAEEVVAEIRATGGEALASNVDVSDWDCGRGLVRDAIDTFGRLDILVNNAGILRDSMIVNVSERDWDEVIRVHLRGHFVPLRFAAEYWRAESKAGVREPRSVINTTSTSGLHASVGQASYGAAKMGIVGLTEIAAKELSRYGVRVNAIAPSARTRLTTSSPAVAEIMAPPQDGEFDAWDPANISPLVAWLASSLGTVTGRTFYIQGGRIALYRPYERVAEVAQAGRWAADDIGGAIEDLLAEEIAGADRKTDSSGPDRD